MTPENRPSLLLVDDEPDLLLSLQGLLRQHFQLYVADSGAAALEIVQTESIQIVMSDQRMPQMSGDELLACISRISPATVRILLTGYADIHDVIRALNTGGLFRYLTKPWDLDELMDVLQEAAEHYRQSAEQQATQERVHQFAQDIVSFLSTLPPSEQIDVLMQRGRELSSGAG